MNFKRIHNFSAGPSKLPDEVLDKIREHFNDPDRGFIVSEISHRSPYFEKILAKAERDLRRLMDIPEDYTVIFTQGGASLHFTMTALNLANAEDTGEIINTGVWSAKAIDEARKFCKVKIPLSSEDDQFRHIPDLKGYSPSPSSAFVHITTNNTIFGTEYFDLPNTGNVPLVADTSSDILGRKLDVRKFGVIYFGAQKNAGISGLAIAIIRKDLVEKARSRNDIPRLLNYSTYADFQSMFNTPNTMAIWTSSLVFEWLLEKGGVEEMEKINRRKSSLIYDEIDADDFYKGHSAKNSRSIINIPFRTSDDKTDKLFLTEAENVGLFHLKGHKLAGGVRASLYNAIPESSAVSLAEFMRHFRKTKG